MPCGDSREEEDRRRLRRVEAEMAKVANPLTISELITLLQKVKEEHGDLPVAYTDSGLWDLPLVGGVRIGTGSAGKVSAGEWPTGERFAVLTTNYDP